MTTNRTFANTEVSITELGRNPDAVIEEAGIAPVAIVREDGTAAYVVAADVFEAMIEALDDADLAGTVNSRRGGPTRKVTLDDL